MIELIQSGIFTIFFILSSTIVGYTLANLIKTEQKNFFFHFIIGYFLLITIQWFIVVPSTIFNLSWQFYKSIYLLIIGILIIISFVYAFKNINKIYTYIVGVLKTKRFYFVVTVSILFAGFSILYITPFFNANHQDDGFYLARVVQEIGVAKMGIIDPVIGTNLHGFDLIRSINTYEVFYGLMADISTINPVIMARVAFTMINAFAIICGIQYIFSKIDKKNSYIYVSAFSLFLLPESVYHTLGLTLTDAWRLNTAVWYGSTIAKFLLPTLLLGLLFEFNKKKQNSITEIVKELFLLAIVAVGSIAFASQSLLMLVLALIGYVIVLIKRSQNKKVKYIAVIGYFLVSLLVTVVFKNNIANLYEGNYSQFSNIWIYSVTTLGVLILSTVFILKRKHKEFGFSLLIVVILSTVPILNSIFVFSGQFIFVFQRFYESILYLMITFVIAELVIFCFKNIKFKVFISIVLIVSFSTVYLTENYEKKRISIYQSLINLDDTPEIIDQVGDYFSDEKYNNTQVLTPHLVNYDSKGVYLGVQFKMVPTNFINLGAIPRYENEFYDTETIVQINNITDCALAKSDFSEEIEKIQELGIDYILFQPCVPKERIEQVPGEVEQIFYSEKGNPFILKKVTNS